LLEQAEALMQRDRAALLGDGIPTLIDSVPAPGGGPAPALDARRAPSALDDIPMLTEAIEDFDTLSIPLSKSLDDELALWRETADASPQAASVDVPSVEALHVETPAQPEIASADVATTAEVLAEPPPPSAAIELPSIDAAPPVIDESARWDALAEDIRMQVLQRIDIFTDTGLKDQLNQRLQPIVDRASADLVAAINQHVGQLLRAYVAEAIEREIEKWRENAR
jgi:hypothetical protein